jgi:outer membrane protein, heavy metal efflux system
VISAGARPNPAFEFAPTYSEPPLEFFSPWTLGFMVDVPIETAGKRGYRIAQANHLVNAATLSFVSTDWQVRRQVRENLLDLYAARTTRQILVQQQIAQSNAVQLLEDRFQAGQSSLGEVQLIRVAYAQAALQIRDVEKQMAQAIIRLVGAIGISQTALTNVILSFEPFERAIAPPPLRKVPAPPFGSSLAARRTPERHPAGSW